MLRIVVWIQTETVAPWDSSIMLVTMHVYQSSRRSRKKGSKYYRYRHVVVYRCSNGISCVRESYYSVRLFDITFINGFILCCILSGCKHELCVKCALYLCSTSNIPSELVGPPGSIPCPLCRHGIVSFAKLPGSLPKETKLHLSLSLCTPCMLHPREPDRSTPACTPEIRRNRVASVSSDIFCPVTCSPFPSVAIPLCTCNDGPCPPFENRESETVDESPHRSQSASVDQDKVGVRLEKTSCSSMFWGRRSCSREQQCNSEINAWSVSHKITLSLWVNFWLKQSRPWFWSFGFYQSQTLRIFFPHLCLLLLYLIGWLGVDGPHHYAVLLDKIIWGKGL